MIIHGDCLEEMRRMESNSISAIVTDPPYGLGFMGNHWDAGLPHHEIWQEALRIMKPGGHLLAFGGTRTYHRLTCAIEDAGWEIRDSLMWIYGSGFPKSHNHFGIEGYGTALKPAHEQIIMCSKPYEIYDLLCIILLEITGGLEECQKSNCSVEDAEMILCDTLAWLSRELKHIAPENVKTSELESFFNVNFVKKNATSLWLGLSEKINREKEFFAHINAKANGKKEDIQVTKILAGVEETIFAGIRGIAISVAQDHIKPNTGLLWSAILVGLCQGANKFTIETAINLITELRTLKSYLSPTISSDTGNLSPNYQPIIMAMKPCEGTFKQNAEKWGQAGINIDGCRIETEDDLNGGGYRGIPTIETNSFGFGFKPGKAGEYIQPRGRWPANVLFDEEAAKVLDEQSGMLKSGERKGLLEGESVNEVYGKRSARNINPFQASSGGASRFFYCAKASSSERNEGLDTLPDKVGGGMNATVHGDTRTGNITIQKNNHPTVKPLKLMEYLIKLVMPPKDGILLDPFAGSGTTILAAQRLGYKAIGIEKELEYCEIARARLNSLFQINK